jgi:hypothetical protein
MNKKEKYKNSSKEKYNKNIERHNNRGKNLIAKHNKLELKFNKPQELHDKKLIKK